MKSNTKKLTEAAMMVAIVGVMLFINRQFAGILEYAAYWVMGFPILIYTLRYGMKEAIVPAVSMLLLACIIALPTTVFYLFSAVVVGLVYGGGVRKHWSSGVLLWTSGILTLFSYLITMVIFASIFGFDPQEDILMTQVLLDTLHIEGVNLGQMVLVFSLLLTCLTAVLQTICVHLFATLIMQRLKIEANSIKTAFEIRLPKVFGYISICIWLLFLLQNVIKLEGNLYAILITLYVVVCILMVGEFMLTILCGGILLQRRLLSILLMLAIFPFMMWDITRNLCIGLGILCCLGDVRLRWKRGVYHGTFGKS